MDRRPLPLAAIAGSRTGPAIIFGGGIQVPDDLKALGEVPGATLISANAQGFKVADKMDFIVCKDDRSTETKKRMEPIMRRFGVPIISRHWWADYRAADWSLQGNSGLMAIAVAAVLGCSPIYPVGFDFYQDGTYWYDPTAKNVSRGRALRNHLLKANAIAEEIRGADVRPLSGPLKSVFGKTEYPIQEPRLLTKTKATKLLLVKALEDTALPISASARIPARREFWISETEHKNYQLRRSVEVLDRWPRV